MAKFVFAVALGSLCAISSGQNVPKCGQGTVYVASSQSCEIIPELQDALNSLSKTRRDTVSKRQTVKPQITSTGGDVTINVEDGKKVGYSVGGKQIFFNDLPENWKESDVVAMQALQMGYNLGKAAPSTDGLFDYINTTQRDKIDGLSNAISSSVEAFQNMQTCASKGTSYINGVCVSTPLVVSSADTDCTANNVGALKYDKNGEGLWVCNKDQDWIAVGIKRIGGSSSSPGKSCATIKTDGFSFGSGLYWIERNGKPTLVGCDMSGNGEIVENGSSKEQSVQSCSRMHDYYSNLDNTFTKHWIGGAEWYCSIQNNAVVGGPVGVTPFGDGSAANKASFSCQFKLDTSTLKANQVIYLANPDGSNVRTATCEIDRNTAVETIKDGTTAAKAAVTCKDILAVNPASKTGTYFLTSKNGAVQKSYCEMTTNGGGWTQIVKVSNQDSPRFYNRGEGAGNRNPLVTGSLITPSRLLTRSRNVDSLGYEYGYVKGTDLMIYDEQKKTWVSGTFGGAPMTLKDRLTLIPFQAPTSGTGRCALAATDLKKSGSNIQVGAITVTNLGLKCEDDNQNTFICTDDGVYIGWGQQGTYHSAGIAKCGRDGGDDIYNRGNAETSADVSVWIR